MDAQERPAEPNGQPKRRRAEKLDGENGPGTRLIVVDDRTEPEKLYAAYYDLYNQFRELERQHEELLTLVGTHSERTFRDLPEDSKEAIAYAKGLRDQRARLGGNRRESWQAGYDARIQDENVGMRTQNPFEFRTTPNSF